MPVLRLCAEAGLVRVGLVAFDGTKLQANAASHQNYDLDRFNKAIALVSEQVDNCWLWPPPKTRPTASRSGPDSKFMKTPTGFGQS